MRGLQDWTDEKVHMADPELEQKFRDVVVSMESARKTLADEAEILRKDYQNRNADLIMEYEVLFEELKARTAQLAEKTGLTWYCFDSVVGRVAGGGYGGDGHTPFSFYVPTTVDQWADVSKELRRELHEHAPADYMKRGEWYESALC